MFHTSGLHRSVSTAFTLFLLHAQTFDCDGLPLVSASSGSTGLLYTVHTSQEWLGAVAGRGRHTRSSTMYINQANCSIQRHINSFTGMRTDLLVFTNGCSYGNESFMQLNVRVMGTCTGHASTSIKRTRGDKMHNNNIGYTGEVGEAEEEGEGRGKRERKEEEEEEEEEEGGQRGGEGKEEERRRRRGGGGWRRRREEEGRREEEEKEEEKGGGGWRRRREEGRRRRRRRRRREEGDGGGGRKGMEEGDGGGGGGGGWRRRRRKGMEEGGGGGGEEGDGGERQG